MRSNNQNSNDARMAFSMPQPKFPSCSLPEAILQRCTRNQTRNRPSAFSSLTFTFTPAAPSPECSFLGRDDFNGIALFSCVDRIGLTV